MVNRRQIFIFTNICSINSKGKVWLHHSALNLILHCFSLSNAELVSRSCFIIINFALNNFLCIEMHSDCLQPCLLFPIYLSSSLLISFSYSCLLFCLCPSGLDHGYQCGLCIGSIHWSLVHQCLYNWRQQAPLTQIPLVACSSVPRDRAPQSPPHNHSPFMNDWVKVLAMQTWQPEFLPRIHVRIERRKPNP